MFRDYFKAGIGSAIAQAINLAALPIVARLYSPEEYATWAIVIATAAIFGAVACLRYELAIVLPEDKEDASALFVWSMASPVLFGLLVALIMALGDFEFDGHPAARHYTLLAPLLVTATGVTLALQYWVVRHAAYVLNSIALVTLALVTLGFQFAYAVNYAGVATGLIIGSLVGQFAAIVTLALGCIVGRNLPTISGNVLRRILPMVREHYRFPLYSLPYVLFGTIRQRASVYVIALFLGPREVGLYAMAYRVLNFPVSLVSAALRPVLFKEASAHGVAMLENRVNLILRWLAVFATPLVVVYFYHSDDLFALAFGDRWEGAALYGDFFILPVFTFMFCNWMDRIMDVVGQQRLTMTLEIAFGSLSVLLLWLAFAVGLGLLLALAVQCAVLIVYNLSYLVLAFDRAGYRKRALLAHLGTIALAGTGTVILMELLDAGPAG